ncbi:amino acid permease [Nannocystis sp.]|uniref:amino acid permease n=1 Tax=Nannocystis sp. TaxID=1962667 RepID=UPI0025E6C44E|nr:amino acid permease [Nannocystis sp.]
MLAIAMIVVVGAINRRGVEFGAVVQNLSTVLKVGALLGLIALGLLLVPGELPVHTVIERAELPAFVLGMIAILWAYDGWCDVGFVEREIRDPQRRRLCVHPRRGRWSGPISR